MYLTPEIKTPRFPATMYRILLLSFQLHTLVTDENCFQMLECYSNFVETLSPSHSRVESRVAMEMAYQGKVEPLLNGENCFKIIFVSRAV